MVKQPPSRRVDHSLSNFFTLAKPSLAKPGSVDPPDVWYYIEPGQPTDTLDSTNPVSMEHDEDELPWDLVLQSGQIMAAAKDWSFKCLADPQPQDAPKIVSLSKRKHPNDALEAMAKSSKKVCPDKPELKKDAPKGIRAAQGTTLVQKTTPTTPATDIKSRVGFCVSNSVKLGEKTPLVVKEVDSGPRLSPEQEKVLHRAVYSEHSLFFTGPAGTGKSVLLREIITKMKSIYGDRIAVTASTGVAACNINGTTFHSFAGVGLGKQSVSELVSMINKSQSTLERWKYTRTLIIDEISMIDGYLFDKVEQVARKVRENTLPFGGIQVILTGDFFQLPPVNEGKTTKFAFEAECWPRVVNATVVLSKVFRQTENGFIDLLNDMRLGHLSLHSIDIFRCLTRELSNIDDLQPTELYPVRDQVDRANTLRLQALPGKIYEFHAEDKGILSMLKGLLATETVRLKRGAQVMLLKNLDKHLVNGSMGVIVGFLGDNEYSTPEQIQQLVPPGNSASMYFSPLTGKVLNCFPIIKFTNHRAIIIEKEKWSFESSSGLEIASRTQVPLMLAWAMSIHKSQGQTLEYVRIDLKKAFESGQVYVAISRAVSLEKLQVLNFNPAKVIAHPKVTKFYESLQTA